MTTTRSSLNPGRFLLGFLLRRNLPAGLCFFGVSFFCFPLQYILEIFFSRPSPDGILYLYMSTRAHIYTGLSLAVMFAMVPALSLLLALVQAHWLHSRRASDLYHSLPIRRESLLLANAGAVFFTIALPLTLDYLITLGAGALRLAIGLPHEIAHGSLRLSLGDMNTPDEVEEILKAVPQVVERLRAMSPVWEKIKDE